MKTYHKQLVRRSMDRGHREVMLVVDWEGLPEFAPFVISSYVFFLILQDEVLGSGNEPIHEVYEYIARDEMEKLLFQIGTPLE